MALRKVQLRTHNRKSPRQRRRLATGRKEGLCRGELPSQPSSVMRGRASEQASVLLHHCCHHTVTEAFILWANKDSTPPTSTPSPLIWNNLPLSQAELCPQPPAMRLISPSLHKPMIKTNQRFVLQIINPTSGESPRLLLEFQLQESLQVSARLNLRQYSTGATCPAASLASSLGLQTLHFKEHTSKSCQHLMLLSVTSLKSASLPVNTRATCLSHAEYSPFITGTHRFYFSA